MVYYNRHIAGWDIIPFSTLGPKQPRIFFIAQMFPMSLACAGKWHHGTNGPWINSLTFAPGSVLKKTWGSVVLKRVENVIITEKIPK